MCCCHPIVLLVVYSYNDHFAVLLLLLNVILLYMCCCCCCCCCCCLFPVIVPLFHLDRASLRTAIILFPFLGLGWTLGFFIFGENLDYIQAIEWIFFVVVTLQGILIFVLNCLVNTEVRCPYINLLFFCSIYLCFIQLMVCVRTYYMCTTSAQLCYMFTVSDGASDVM